MSRIGYAVVRASKRLADGVDALRERLAGETSVLVGQSGVGKSSLTNALVPGVEAAVAEVTRASESGRHTTTTSALYALPSGGELIDSPGVRDFAPPLPPPREIAGGFREIAARPPTAGSAIACTAASRAARWRRRRRRHHRARRLESYRRLLALAEEMAARAASRVRR